jgi:ADP-heptose:LPS heptosyltransferase
MQTPQPLLAPGGDRLEGVRRIAVLRSNAIGDFIVAVPALEALRAAYPEAEITYLGAALHPGWLAGRPGPWDRVEAVPAPEGAADNEKFTRETPELARFLAGQRARRYDLAVQLHGGGGNSNPFACQLGARVTIGSRAPGAAALDRWVPYLNHQHEVLRFLEVVGLVGAVPVILEPRLAVVERDRREAAAALAEVAGGDPARAANDGPGQAVNGGAGGTKGQVPGGGAGGAANGGACRVVNGGAGGAAGQVSAGDAGGSMGEVPGGGAGRGRPAEGGRGGRRLVAFHAGANDPRRRWPPERFAAVADALAERGALVVLVGAPADAGLSSAVRRAMRHQAADLTGRLSLCGLTGLLARCALLVGNDSGPRHLAAAVGTATVAVYLCGNLVNAGPLTRARHRIGVSFQNTCPVCGREQGASRCAHDAPFVLPVPVEEIRDHALDLLDTEPVGEGTVPAGEGTVPAGKRMARAPSAEPATCPRPPAPGGFRH